MEFCIGKKGEKREIIPFINEVFGEDFPLILPKAYGDNQYYEEYHHLVKENGTITAVIGDYEQDFFIQDMLLKIGCVGSVSVAKKARGKGYMKLLMQKTEESMRKNQVDLAILGGLRNRYGFFGFEIGGYVYEFHFAEENIRHTIGWEHDGAVILKKVDEKDSILDDIYALYRKQHLVWCRTREDFYVKSVTWNQEIVQIQIDGAFGGYLIIKGNSIAELELVNWDKNTALRVIKACMVRNKDTSLHLQVQGWQRKNLHTWYTVAESYSLRTGCSYKILNYPNTIKALLGLKKTYADLEDGECVFEIKGIGSFLIQVKGNEIQVKETTGQKVDLILTEQEAVTVLFSPAGAFYLGKQKKCLKNWFPVEFSVSHLDEF